MGQILYIEDNPLNRRLVYKTLTAADYEVLLAGDGATGQTMVKEISPDLILLDVNLPDINGLSLAIHLKSHPACRHIPIIALTANGMHGDRAHCLDAGCDDYLAKPVMRIELLNVVRKYIGSSEAALAQVKRRPDQITPRHGW